MASISIILPVFNVEKYIDVAIKSALGQAVVKELVIVNDGSTDNSLSKIMKYENNLRVKIVNIPNSGLSMARNEGLKYCTGDFIYFMDSDDALRMGALDRIVDCMQKYDVELACLDYVERPNQEIDDEINKPLGNVTAEQFYEDTNQILTDLMFGNVHQMAWSYVIKRSVFDSEKNRFSKGRLFEDNNSAVKFFGSVNNAIKLSFENAPYILRNRGDSITATAYRDKSVREFEDELFVFQDAYNQFKLHGLTESEDWFFRKKIHLRIKYGN